MDRRILIVKHVTQEGAGVIEEFFRSDGWELAIVELGNGEKLPESPDEFAAMIVLGGPMNVYEVGPYPFLEEEEHLLRKALIAEIPVLGICLGAQLLAKTCGAKVKKASHAEIGWHTAGVTEEGRKDTLFRGLSRQLHVFQWHEDTFEIPAGGTMLVHGKSCRNQAFRVGRNAYGLQFHLEVTLSMIEEWMKGVGGAVDTGKILSDGAELYEGFERQATQFLVNLKSLIESSMRVRRIMKLFVEDERDKKKRSILWWDAKDHALVSQEGT
jgi:GMP synthase (glutamine-hydrolysing)